MIIKKHVLLVSLLTCILGLSAVASQNNPVERPLKALGAYKIVISLVDGSMVVTGSGNSTLGGYFTSYAEGLAIITPNGPVPVSGVGTITMANGDQLFYETHADGPSNVTTITGGTGRFEGASGTATGHAVAAPVITISADSITIETLNGLEGTVTY